MRGVALSAALLILSSFSRRKGRKQPELTLRLGYEAPHEGHIQNKKKGSGRNKGKWWKTPRPGKTEYKKETVRCDLAGEGPFSSSPARMTLQSAKKSKSGDTATSVYNSAGTLISFFLFRVTNFGKKRGETKAACQRHSDALRCTPAWIFVSLFSLLLLMFFNIRSLKGPVTKRVNHQFIKFMYQPVKTHCIL